MLFAVKNGENAGCISAGLDFVLTQVSDSQQDTAANSK